MNMLKNLGMNLKKIVNFFKKCFNLNLDIQYFQLENRDYTNKELFDILKNETLSLGTGNAIILSIIMRLEDRIKRLESKEDN
jgi:hypothetical protein